MLRGGIDERVYKKTSKPVQHQNNGGNKKSGIDMNEDIDDVKLTEKTINTSLGKQLEDARNRANVTRKQLAQMLACKENVIAQWENGQVEMPGQFKSRCERILKTKFVKQ